MFVFNSFGVSTFLPHFSNVCNTPSWPFSAATCQAVCLTPFFANNNFTKVFVCSVSFRLSNKNPIILALPSPAVLCNVNRPSFPKSCIRFPHCLITSLDGLNLDNIPSINALITEYSSSKNIFSNNRYSICWEIFDPFFNSSTK